MREQACVKLQGQLNSQGIFDPWISQAASSGSASSEPCSPQEVYLHVVTVKGQER